MKISEILESCRLCQNNIGEVCIDENLGRTILRITKIQINDELYPSMPPNICLLCHNTLKDTQSFIDMVQKENEKIRKFVIEKHETEATERISSIIESNRGKFEKTSKHSERKVVASTVCSRRSRRIRSSSSHKKSHQKSSLLCDTLFEAISIKETNEHGKSNSQFFEIENSTKILEPNIETNPPQTKFTKDDVGDDNFELENKVNSEKCNSPENEIVLDENYLNFTSSRIRDIEKLNYKNKNNEKRRPFLCVTCGKDFSTKNSLTCHEKIHSAVKGYKCDPCQVEFSVRSNLRAHIRKYHEGVRFYCSQCTKEFLTKCSLDRHEKIHTGIKEFKCEHCSSAFYTNKELVKHQRYHQGLKQHKCEQCFKTFFERHHLIIHLRSHSGERPYVCNVAGCGKSFVESQKLKRHHKAKHIAKQ